MKFKIESRWDDRVLFEGEFGSLKLCVEAAVEAGANLARASLARASLAGASLDGAIYDGPPPASKEESIANLDRVREIILDQPDRLFMNHWHATEEWKARTCAEEATCGTTHCLAGWLQVCATDDKVRSLPANFAGAICAPVAAKMFFRSNDEVMSWLKEKRYVQEAV